MAKTTSAYFCQNCGYESVKWLGKCPACHSWNTFVEELTQTNQSSPSGWDIHSKKEKRTASKPQPIKDIDTEKEQRLNTHDVELNRVLGGGIVSGSMVLVGGEPGIGKSTLMLQLALSMPKIKVLYISGEESAQQIKMRSERLNFYSNNCYILTETNTQNIFNQAQKLEPALIIVDSIQTLHATQIESAEGSVSQVRTCTAELLRFAKETNTPVVLIGHITKEGSLAGPKVLEHMVDTVLQFEGDRHSSYRILRTIKNRFGSAAELGIYEMRSTGLRQVNNPSEILISQREGDLSGIAIGATLEGNRPLLIEVQSLVSPSAYGTPQRSCTGFDTKRLNMLLAVLEKRGGFKLNFSDIFLNITGGLKIEDPAIDLAVCASIISAINDYAVRDDTCFAAEMGLGGEIRAIHRVEHRITEAEKLGFKTIYISKFNTKGLDLSGYNINIISLNTLNDMLDICQ